MMAPRPPLFPFLSLLLSFLVLAICTTRPVSAFAQWIKCRTELEEGEVIMNHAIRPHTKSRHKSVRLVAYKNDELVSSFPENGDVPFEPGDEFVIRMFTPEEFDGGQLQFVLETTEGGTFGKPNMCDGSRAIGMKQQSEARITIGGETAGEHADVGVVYVWAGWAREHEAVTLTPELTFRRADGKGTMPSPEDTVQPPADDDDDYVEEEEEEEEEDDDEVDDDEEDAAEQEL